MTAERDDGIRDIRSCHTAVARTEEALAAMTARAERLWEAIEDEHDSECKRDMTIEGARRDEMRDCSNSIHALAALRGEEGEKP